MLDELSDQDLFQEPAGFYKEAAPYTYQSFKLPDGREINVRLVGHNPLWGHLLFPASRHITEYLINNNLVLIQGRSVLELGAGSGLPSLVCAFYGAARVVLTDFPDAELLQNLQHNVATCNVLTSLEKDGIFIDGHLWGSDATPLLNHISRESPPQSGSGLRCNQAFDTLILSDLVFNHSEHAKLLTTVRRTMARKTSARALVFFTPHRPWLVDDDMRFFELATKPPPEGDSLSISVRRVLHHIMDRSMFEEDKTKDRNSQDELLRRTVFGYELFWRDLQ